MLTKEQIDFARNAAIAAIRARDATFSGGDWRPEACDEAESTLCRCLAAYERVTALMETAPDEPDDAFCFTKYELRRALEG